MMTFVNLVSKIKLIRVFMSNTISYRASLRPNPFGFCRHCFIYILPLIFFGWCIRAQAQLPGVIVGAERTNEYFGRLKDKRIALVVNPTSRIGNVHLVDTLLDAGMTIACVFAPEHGFRGEAEAGESVKGGVDPVSGVKVISLYGAHKKPSDQDLAGVDLVVFDIQDVGARFYTYISTLQYMMEACAKIKLPLIVLDRPNPHGHYVDGPVLDTAFRSFVGMQPVPVVHGMTVAEYARMLNGESMLEDGRTCELIVVTMLNWSHSSDYSLPVPPSPNLPNDYAVRLYPSLCFFEGTAVSLGRGTEIPFQCYGYPGLTAGNFLFTPVSVKGKSARPLYEGQLCNGFDLRSQLKDKRPDTLLLNYLITAWKDFPDRKKFFNPFFDKLAGSSRLRMQIESGMSASAIRQSWQEDLERFKKKRQAWLLYP